jgi:hypothetical protein
VAEKLAQEIIIQRKEGSNEQMNHLLKEYKRFSGRNFE